MDYKSTLNLPKTDFPMKANLAKREPEQLQAWEDAHLYDQIRMASKDREMFILHDGPPYANGHIHMGTALNKILKDIIVRYKQMNGYNAVYVPGWDCHGLPIEHNVDQKLGKKKAELSKVEIRKLCREYAEAFVQIQKDEFKRLGVMGQWDNPYLTMNYSYEATIARECFEFASNGSLYKNKKPIHWCCHCRTALAEAEIEYQEEKSPSIFVKFRVKDDLPDILPQTMGKPVYAVIWTTTPWTIPANLAVALHPDYNYGAYETENNEVLILAEALAEKCMETFGIVHYQKIGSVNPRDLEGKKCSHPFYDRDSLLILGEHVTLDAGTGCVHTAPGHGREDHEAALKYGLEIYSPVDDGGCFTGDVALFNGQFVFKANDGITETLKENGSLLASGKIAHSYPHCWRCKKPVIFRATPQWFISMEKTGLRKKALEAIDTVQWIPSWGRDRIYGMVENRPDWCISRQRVWGVPIALFSCEACEALLMDKKTMEHICDLFEKFGTDIWFEKSPEQLLPGDVNCQSCGKSQFRKENDILDVWFDSGVSHAAVLEQRENLQWPADLYLEGTDQHRGWFQSSLLTAVGNRGKAPYKSVLTCGFVVDAEGKKMSKSLGNFIAPDVLIQKYGAEILRLWVSASDYQDDIRISENILKQLSDAYRRIRNTSRFMLGNLFDFDPVVNGVDYSQMMEIDRFALHRLQSLIAKVKKGYERYEFHQIYHALFNFCTLDLSAFYLDILKDRLYTSTPNSLERRSAQTVMHILLNTMAKLMAPILSFTAEEIWSHMPQCKDKTTSIHLSEMPVVNASWMDDTLGKSWELILAIRAEVTKVLETARVNKVIGHSLDARVVLHADKGLFEKLQPYKKELATLFIVSEAFLQEPGQENTGAQETGMKELKVAVLAASGDKCDRCWIHDTSVGASTPHPTLCRRCETALESM